MLRIVLGIVAGYVFIFVFIVSAFSALYAVMGAETAYKPGSFEVSMTWIIPAFALGIIASLGAGWICFLVSKSKIAVKILAGIVLVMGMAGAVGQLVSEKPAEARTGEVDGATAMSKSVSPVWVNTANSFFVAFGVLVGGNLKKED